MGVVFMSLAAYSGEPSDGPSLLMFHGVTRRAYDLEPLYSAINGRVNWQAIDLPGHGESPRSNRRYAVVDYVDAIAPIIAGIDQPPIYLFGHSLGAMVALMAASRWPDSVRGVILEDPPFSTMGDRFHSSFLRLQFEGLSRLLRQYDDEEGLCRGLMELPVKRASDGAVVRFIELRDAASLRTYAQYLQNVDPAVLEPIVGGRWMNGYDLSTVCASVRCPVLVFQASQKLGGMLTEDDLSTLQSGLMECEVIKATESGHMIHATHGDQMVQALIRFLGADAGI